MSLPKPTDVHKYDIWRKDGNICMVTDPVFRLREDPSVEMAYVMWERDQGTAVVSEMIDPNSDWEFVQRLEGD